MNVRADFIGIDLTSSSAKPSAIAGLTQELDIVFYDFLRPDEEIIEAVQRHHPQLVAIDSPLGLPRGLCCLEDDWLASSPPSPPTSKPSPLRRPAGRLHRLPEVSGPGRAPGLP